MQYWECSSISFTALPTGWRILWSSGAGMPMVPVKSLRRTGWRIFLIFFLVLTVIALPVARFAGEPLADIHMEQRRQEPAAEETAVQQEEISQSQETGDPQEALENLAEPPKWLADFFRVSQVAVVPLVVVAALWLIFHWLKKMAGYYASQEGDQVISLRREEREQQDEARRLWDGKRETFFGEEMPDPQEIPPSDPRETEGETEGQRDAGGVGENGVPFG